LDAFGFASVFDANVASRRLVCFGFAIGFSPFSPKGTPSYAALPPESTLLNVEITHAESGGSLSSLRGFRSVNKNVLYYGDNLDVLRRHVDNESVDLVYLDPPFKSMQDYNVLFAEHDGTRAAAQIKAFEDTWRWDESSARAYQEVVEQGGRVSEAMQAFHSFLGSSDMMAYLAMMAPRLAELRRVMKDSASIYLHCDPTASHYLKMLMDAVFGPEKFRGEITWKRTNVHSDAKRWSPVADSILYYGKSAAVTWNPSYSPHSDAYLESKYRFEEEDGRKYRLDNMTSPKPRPNMMYTWKGHESPPLGWRYSKETMAKLDAEGRIWYPDSKRKRPQLKRYLDEMPGVILGNVWTDIDPINSRATERLGYPTQKPTPLLERIIRASSNEADLVLDPFCGCGTSISAAQRLKRAWVGIDITHLAIGLIRSRLRDEFGDDIAKTYKVLGEPTTFEDAAELAKEDPYQFQWWALGLVGARRDEEKKGADKGVDGKLIFHDESLGGKTKNVILSVKAGKLHAHYVRDLRGVIDREKAEIGVLLSMEKPTKQMRAEAASAGFYKSPWNEQYPRIQLLTIEDLLGGKGIAYPAPRQTNVTLKKARRARQDGENRELF
jgi:site-specific DNA-methyltransferase (adenine-specific)